MTYQVSLGCYYSLVHVRPRELPQLYGHLEWTPYTRSVFFGCQKHGNEVNVDTMLQGVMWGMSVPPPLSRFTSFLPSVPRPPVHL